jgi:hypothetical protein
MLRETRQERSGITTLHKEQAGRPRSSPRISLERRIDGKLWLIENAKAGEGAPLSTREGAPLSTRESAPLSTREGATGRTATRGALRATPVDIVRCFPWSHPTTFLSLRDSAGAERAFVADPSELDPESRAELERALSRSSFVLEVVRILKVTEDFELRCFEVETRQGLRRFQTALDAWPRELENGALILEDVHGDLYRVCAPNELDAGSRREFAAFID